MQLQDEGVHSEPLDDLRKRAREEGAAGHWATAAELYDRLAASPSATARDLHDLAAARIYARQLDAVRPVLDRLAGRVPGAELAMLEAAWHEQRQEDHDAIRHWADARHSGGHPYWTAFGEARSWSRVGHLRKARDLMATALASDDGEEQGWRFALEVDLKLLDYASARGKFHRLGITDEEAEMAQLLALPGMTYPEERRAVYAAARTVAGEGQIVDLGCFLGSLTAALAAGLAHNPPALERHVRVHAYDRFVWGSGGIDMPLGDLFPQHPGDGDSFLPLFEQVTAPWRSYIDVHSNDLLLERWDGPIELLSIDAMKTPSLARHIVSAFIPHVVQGGTLFHQDFKCDSTWWILVVHYLLRNHFTTTDSLPGATGMMCRVVLPVSDTQAKAVAAVNFADPVLAAEAFAYCESLVAAEDRPFFERVREQFDRDCSSPGAVARARAQAR